jgi:branched-chain amino acid transport system substrate-binding protein
MLAIEQANAAGGISGRAIEPIIKDHRMEPERAKAALQELFDARVVAIIGPMTSQIAITVLPEVNRARIPMISPTVSTSRLFGLDDYFLRVYYSSSQAAALLADYLATRKGLPRMVAFYDVSNLAFTEDWVRNFGQHYAQRQGQLLDVIPFELNNGVNYSELADLALIHNPQGILLLANAVDTAMIAQQLGKRRIRIPLYAAGWSYSDDLPRFGGQSVEGITIVQSANPESPRPESQAFRQAYAERYNESPNFPAMHAYDATRLLLAALAKGVTSGPRLKEELLNLTPRPGALGASIAFDRYGDLNKPELHLATIEQGKFRPLQ